ncbi:RHS repeat domain-containing protein, partial [Pseudomonas viridiflava]
PESFAHDPAGNLLGQGDQPAANLANVKGNRLLMQGDRHYDYDAYGNQIRERRGTGQKLVTEYRYDCQHRLIGVSLPGGSVASYKYDAFGRRIEKTVDGHTTEFLWQGERLIAESADNRYRSYIYEPGTFRPLAMLDGEGPLKAAPFYYQLDHLGTPQELTDYSGEIMWSAKYRAYGNLATLDVSEIDNPLRFQGQYFDAETGLHYNRHRYYNPGTGRFLTPDPIKLAGGLNNYQYVPNPTGWVDPLGLSGECPDSEKNKIPVEEASSPSNSYDNSEELRPPESNGRRYAAGKHYVNPQDINFSQRGVHGNEYEAKMSQGDWDWSRPGSALNVMEVDGQLVSYDNRRLRAARSVGLNSIPIQIVLAEDIMPGSKKTWEKAFKLRREDRRNLLDGEPVPPKGLNTLPKINE